VKFLSWLAFFFAAIAGILLVSVSSAVREQGRRLDQFAVTSRSEVHGSIEALSARLDALDQDTRMLVDLIQRSPDRKGDVDQATERRIWASAFQALALVVPQYRVLAFIREDGTEDVLAVDPTETQATVEALRPYIHALGSKVAAADVGALGKPAVRLGERSFLLYGTPVRGRGAVVVASDAAIFLRAVVWTPLLPVSRLFVTDPASVVWVGCGTPAGCRATATETERRHVLALRPEVDRLSASDAESLGLGRAPAVQLTERVRRPTGDWIVTWVASAQPVLEDERSLVLRLVLTAVAVALAVGGIGAVLLRQQHKSLALEARLRFAQELASARATSEALVASAPLGLVGLSQDGRVLLANEFLTARLGPVKIGERLETAFVGEGARWMAEVGPLLQTELARQDDERHATRDVLAASSDLQPFLARFVRVKSPESDVRIFAILEDRSELRELENQLVRAEKLITLGVLSAGIAHEIGSPLAVIRGRAEQVLRELGQGPRAADLRVIIKHIDLISSTIRQLLDFSRRQPIVRQAVSFGVVVERARGLVAWKLDARRVTLTEEWPATLPPLSADPDQLQQVLVNLLLNACDASLPGATIKVAARAIGRTRLQIDIVDHGAGIAAEHLNAVFDPFFTTKERGEGTGLGLSIVASVVRNHGGEVRLDSTEGAGTTVTLFWPVHEVEMAHA